MINGGSLDEIMALIAAFMWPLTRISAFILAAPLFSLDVINLRIRIVVALVLTLFVFEAVAVPEIDPFTAAGLGQLMVQALIGIAMGFALQVVTAAVVVGGEAISNAIGLGFASMVDPNLGNVPLVAQFLMILSTLIFLTMGGHLFVIQLLFESFQSIPIGTTPPLDEWFDIFLRWIPFIFTGAINLALSMMVALLVVNIGLGVITRSAPSLNIIAVGFPAILLVGLLALNLNITAMVYTIERLWQSGLDVLQSLPGA
jgi:flagellar biosynthetic protein FliR